MSKSRVLDLVFLALAVTCVVLSIGVVGSMEQGRMGVLPGLFRISVGTAGCYVGLKAGRWLK